MSFLNFFKQKKFESETVSLDMSNIPAHIAIIMDGNGRWAQSKNLPRSFGHKAGVEAIRDIVKECNRLGVKYLTLYAFSTENWKRPTDEVNILMNLLVEFLQKELKELNRNGVVVNSIGDINKLPPLCQRELKSAYEKTKNNKGVVLNLALNYGGRLEIINAFKQIMKDVKEGKIAEKDITEDLVSTYLYTSNMPDPDIIIRPSGEQRLSNFLLWQCAYAEFWYSNIKWPDFRAEDLHNAILDYQCRDRRFGKIK